MRERRVQLYMPGADTRSSDLHVRMQLMCL